MKYAAKNGDEIVATDTHLVDGARTAFPFKGKLTDRLSATVFATDRAVAVVGSQAVNVVIHVAPPGKSFARPPTNQGTVIAGSATVFIEDRPIARDGDTALTCGDPDAPVGKVVAGGTVVVG